MADSDNIKAEVASRLKKAREALRLTQKDMCERTGMPLPSLRNYELAKQIPGGEALAAFMRAGIAPAWVLTGTGEMFCRPPQLLGAAIAEAIRKRGLAVDDAVATLDVSTEELSDYLAGTRAPEEAFLVKVSEATGYPLSRLTAARDMGDAVAQIEVMHARVTSGLREAQAEAAREAAAAPDEAELLARYRSADEKGKALMRRIAVAVAEPSMKAWFDAGLALSEAATIFDRK